MNTVKGTKGQTSTPEEEKKASEDPQVQEVKENEPEEQRKKKAELDLVVGFGNVYVEFGNLDEAKKARLAF